MYPTYRTNVSIYLYINKYYILASNFYVLKYECVYVCIANLLNR